ncbi:hypothetical protein G7K_2663-t1 [Saitoella complicata NRRL Y-17804]|uniref:Uncharacterized protein n=1 Tax=Saitoella complicata (strain BCRC 22490 / CBS 7301 / JCM 7358 / NBRC 10748 / NRRL Y-17804) TaxID=698492 RepID=A0A0E9NGF8_SAICN|nr:hypothetical protein G7K_2663-t1 [Saitoella complicata NRRL Y-17804]
MDVMEIDLDQEPVRFRRLNPLQLPLCPSGYALLPFDAGRYYTTGGFLDVNPVSLALYPDASVSHRLGVH